MGETAPAVFRTITGSAQWCGAACWLEERLYVLTGTWGSASGDAPLRVQSGQASSRHGALAAQWADRLPVRAGVDRASFVVPPPGPVAGVLEDLAGAGDLRAELDGLAAVVLPRLLVTYEAHLAAASPVSDAPVIAALEVAILRTRGEIGEIGQALQLGLKATGVVTLPSEFSQELNGRFGVASGIFPAAWPS